MTTLDQTPTTHAAKPATTTWRASRWRGSHLTPYLFIAPGMILLIAWSYLPSIFAFVISFTRYQPGLPWIWVGGQNYAAAFGSADFWHSVLRSVEYLIIVPIMMFVPLFFAVLMNQKLPGMRFFRTIFFVPVVLSMVVVALLFQEVFQVNGLFNSFLEALHIIHTGIPWLSNPSIALFAVMAVSVWKGIGWYMLLYLAGLQSIPEELYDAAKTDGAGVLARMRHVTIPAIWPFMLFVMIMSTLGAMQVFSEIYLLTQGGPINATTTMLYYVYNVSFQQNEYGYGAAVGIFIWAILVTISVLEFRMNARRFQTR